MSPVELLARVLASYLVGSLIGGLVLGRLRGVDIRALGSGNPGSTNALRTQGTGFALGVLVIDVAKGWVATRLIGAAALHALPREALPVWLPALCGAAAMLGHVYPLWYGFKGGKAVATLLGVVLGLAPLMVLVLLGAWLLIVVCTGFVSLGSMLAAAVLPLALYVGRIEPQAASVAFGVFAAAFILYTHRGNITRLRAGREPRARRLWLLGRGAVR